MPPKLGIVAGGGVLPRLLVEAARREQREVFVLAVKDHASPEVVAKILARHGSLQIEVGPGFFEGVRSDDWPR